MRDLYSINALERLLLNENVDIEVIQAIKSLNAAISFHKTLFVSPDGDDSTGESWTRAYTTIATALENAEDDSNSYTLIMLSAGVHDVNTSGVLEIDKNIALSSITPFTSEIKNTHASATGIFKVTQKAIFSQLSFECSNITGIEFSGANTYGSYLSNIVAAGFNSTQAHTVIKLTGAVGIMAKDVIVAGIPTLTTGVEITGSVNSIWNNLQSIFCILGVYVHSASRLHYFDNLFCHGCTTGIHLDATTSLIVVRKTEFVACATEMIDLGTGTFFQEEIGIDEIVGEEGYTDVLYLTPAGENIDGKSWRRAFNNWADCYAAIPAAAGRMTLVITGNGTYDIDTTGDPTFSKNFTIRGTFRRTCIFTNTHASATSVFKFTGNVNLEELQISMPDINGVIFSSGSSGLYVRRCRIVSTVATKAQTCLTMNLLVGYTIEDSIFSGDDTWTTGIDIQIAGGGTIARCIFAFCLLGGHESNGAGGSCVWRDSEFLSCVTGMLVVSGADDNLFRNLLFTDATTGFNVQSDRNYYEGNTFGTVTTEFDMIIGGGAIDRVLEIDSLAGIEGFTEVLYVSPDGDNSDGKSWNGAFNNLWETIQLVSTTSSHMTLILCAPATYDINITGDPDVNRNVTIRGIGGTQGVGVNIVNNHAGATSILKFTKIAGLFNLGINLGTSNNGIIFSGADAVQGRIENVDIVMAGLTVPRTGVLYENCAFHSQLKVYYIGETTNSTALVFDNLQYYIDFENLFLDCLLGISSTAATDDYMYFNEANVHGCATGVSLTAACNDFIMDEPRFTGNTLNFTAVATADYHIIGERLDVEVIKMYPAGSNAGVNITNNGAAAGVYGNWQTLVAINQITKPFKIIGIAVDNVSDGNAMYFIDIAWGASDTILATIPVRGAVGVSSPPSPDLKTGVIPENSLIRARVQTSNGGADNLDLWLQYVPI